MGQQHDDVLDQLGYEVEHINRPGAVYVITDDMVVLADTVTLSRDDIAASVLTCLFDLSA